MDKSNPDKPQPMDGVDEEKEFLKKLESMVTTSPAPQVAKKPARPKLGEKLGFSAYAIKLRSSLLKRENGPGVIKINKSLVEYRSMPLNRPIRIRGVRSVGPYKLSRESPRFSPISRPVGGGKTEKVSDVKLTAKQSSFLKMCQMKGELRIEQDKTARVLENLHL